MTIKRRRPGMEQLELFYRLPNRPDWNELPEGVKAEARKLLAQMLREYAESLVGGKPKEEATHE